MDFRSYVFRGLTDDRNELIRKNRRLIILRWIYLGILGAIAVGAPYIVQAPTVTVVQHAVIFGSGLVFNTILYFANNVGGKSVAYYNVISFLQIVIDLGVATGGVAIQGGVYSRAIILYVLPILGTGLLLMSKPLVYTTALLSAIAYDTTIVVAMFLGEAEKILPHVGGPFLFYPVLFFIIARLVVYLNEHNMQSAQEESQEELLAMLTHQLRHPGSVIAAIVDQMEQHPQLEDNPELARYVDMIRTENARSIHLVNNVLLAADPLDSVGEEDVEVVGLARQIAHNAALAAQRTEDVQIRAPKEIRLLANMDRLHIVLENTIDNALRFSQSGTPVKIEVQKDDENVYITVTDYGVGMDGEQLATVFEKFGPTTALEGQTHGAGLGMYLVKRLVEADGGYVDIDSLPGEGTRVTITFIKE